MDYYYPNFTDRVNENDGEGARRKINMNDELQTTGLSCKNFKDFKELAYFKEHAFLKQVFQI